MQPFSGRRWDHVDHEWVHVRLAWTRSDLPPLVMVHGFVISSRYLMPVARELAGRFCVLVPDLPGFGRSEGPKEHALDVPELAAWLARWMAAAELSSVPVLANSFGCQVVAELAAQRPDLVERAVLIGPTMDPSASPLEQVKRLLRDALREPPLLWLLHVPDYARVGLRRALAMFRLALRHDMRGVLPHVRAPVLVVRGERDPIVTRAWAEEVARRLPAGRMAVLPDGPHALNYSRPREMARLALPFLEEGTAAATAGRSTPT